MHVKPYELLRSYSYSKPKPQSSTLYELFSSGKPNGKHFKVDAYSCQVDEIIDVKMDVSYELAGVIAIFPGISLHHYVVHLKHKTAWFTYNDS